MTAVSSVPASTALKAALLAISATSPELLNEIYQMSFQRNIEKTLGFFAEVRREMVPTDGRCMRCFREPGICIAEEDAAIAAAAEVADPEAKE